MAPSAAAYRSVMERVERRALRGEGSLEDIRVLQRHRHEHGDLLIGRAAALNLAATGRAMEHYAISYLSDKCVNDCSYCGHGVQAGGERSILSPAEIREDLHAALIHGPSELCLLAGEHPDVTPEYLAMAARIALEEDELRGLRRISFNVAPMGVPQLRTIRQRVDFPLQYRLFQECYDPESYLRAHRHGPKRDMAFRLGAQARALEAGFDSVGIGLLFGLNQKPEGDEEELRALIGHGYELRRSHGMLPKSLSLLRVQAGGDFTPERVIGDEEYLLAHALVKVALPTTTLIATRRERLGMLDALRPLIGMEDLAPKPGVGGNVRPSRFQNAIGDPRSASEILQDLRTKGYRPLVRRERP